LPRRHGFVDTSIYDKPLRPKYVPGDQSQNRRNWNQKFCPLFHFGISLNSFDLAAIHADGCTRHPFC
jgi:hypothetical protein